MNIFMREMKAFRKSLIIWCAGVLFLVAGGMGKYSGFAVSGESMKSLMEQIPKPVQAILGTGSFDLSKASGFYGIIFLYLAVMAAIHASMLGAHIIGKEEADKTSEFLFVKPVSRSRVITFKLLAALMNIIIFNIVTAVSSIALVGYYAKGETVTGDILKLMAGMFIIQLMFMVIGTGIASLSKKPKVAPNAATGILLVTFILSVAIDLNSRLDFLRFFTPFKYYEAKNLMYGGSFEPVYLILSAVIIIALLYATYAFYRKRDLNI